MTVGHLEILRDERVRTEDPLYLVKNTLSGKYVRLGKAETGYLLEQLNADSPQAEIGEYDKLPEHLQKVLKEKFDEWGFLKDSAEAAGKNKRTFDLTKIKLVEFNVEKVIHSVFPVYSKFFSRPSVIIFILMALACVGIAVYSFIQAAGVPAVSGGTASFTLTFTVSDIVVTAVLLILSMAAHELAHAVVCKKYGGEVKSIGILLFFLIPCFYCDVTDIYKIREAKHRKRVALSGVYVNAFLGVLFLLVAFVLTMFQIIVLPFYYFALASLIVSIYNLIPLVKLDGYWYLSAALNVTNLMDKGVMMAYATFFDREIIPALQVTNGHRRILAVYGIAALIFKPLFWGYNIYAICTRISMPETVIWFVAGIGALIMLSDFCKTVMHNYRMIKNDYRRLIRMV